MWELLVNGLSLAEAGYSFISGFSLDKKIEQIRSSQRRIEEIQEELLERSRSARVTPRDVLPFLESFRSESNPIQQAAIARALEDHSRQLRSDVQGETSELVEAAVAEMKRAIDSVRLAQTPARPAPSQFVDRLYRDPFAAGLVEFRDISAGGVWTLKQPQLISPHMSPISWVNPMTGRSYLGRITLAELQKYGINVTPPRYRHTVGGHVYSETHGLYLPTYMISRA